MAETSVDALSVDDFLVGDAEETMGGDGVAAPSAFVGDLQSVFVGDLQSVFVGDLGTSTVFVGDLERSAVFVGDLQSVFVGDLRTSTVFVGDLKRSAVFVGDLLSVFVGDLKTSAATGLFALVGEDFSSSLTIISFLFTRLGQFSSLSFASTTVGRRLMEMRTLLLVPLQLALF